MRPVTTTSPHSSKHPPPQRVAFACLALVLSAVLGPCRELHAAQETSIRALLQDGSWTKGRLVSIDSGAWRVADGSDGKERVIREQDVLAFIADRSRSSLRDLSAGSDQKPGDDAPSPISFGLLEYANGQRLPGNLRVGRDANYWDHRWIGSIPIDLSQIGTMRLRGARTPERRTDGDVILLLNGDVLSGFVERIGNDVEFEPLAADDGTDSKPARRSISNDRIAAIALARSEVAMPSAARIWAIDGSVVDGQALRFEAERGWGFELADPLLAKIRSSRTSDNNAANPIAGLLRPDRIVPLALGGKPMTTLPAGHYQFGIDRSVRIGSTERALLGLAQVELAGPVVAAFALPASVSAQPSGALFTCEVALAEPAPRDVRVDIEFRMGSATSARVSLDAQNRRKPISLPCNPGKLEVAITDGGNGIAGDAVVLDRACFILPAAK